MGVVSGGESYSKIREEFRLLSRLLHCRDYEEKHKIGNIALVLLVAVLLEVPVAYELRVKESHTGKFKQWEEVCN